MYNNSNWNLHSSDWREQFLSYSLHDYLRPHYCADLITPLIRPFVFQAKLSTQCWKADQTVLCTRTKGWYVVIVVFLSCIFHGCFVGLFVYCVVSFPCGRTSQDRLYKHDSKNREPYRLQQI